MSFIKEKEKFIENKLNELGYLNESVQILPSSKKELGDFQINTAMMLAKKYPNEFKASYHYESFIDYVNSDTPSAFDINYNSPEVISKAIQLLRLSGRKTTQIINDDTKLKTK